MVSSKAECNFRFRLNMLTFHFFFHFMFQFEEDLRGDVIVLPAKKLEDLIHLTELCVDLLQQNEEHYAEVSARIHTKYLLRHFQEYQHQFFLIKSKPNENISLEAGSFG